MATRSSEVGSPRDLYAEAVVAAARITRVGDEIGAVHVVVGRRPTYVELRAARLEAEWWGLTVGLSADGGLVLRRPSLAREAAPDPPIGSSPPRSWVDERFAAEIRRLVSNVREWDAGFDGVREGTR